jgi:DNA polymerase-3 subunit beta
MITLPRAALAAELALLGSAVETKGTLPVLAFVRVVFNGSTAHLTTSSIDVTLDTQISAAGESWSGCLPWQQLTALVKALDGNEVVLSVKDGSDRCEIRAGRSRTKLVTLPVTQFPSPDKQSGVTSQFTVDGALLRDGLRRVLPCVSTEESRYSIQGVQFELSDEAFQLVATDGYRLGIATLPPVGVVAAALVPAEGLRALLGWQAETVAITLSDNVVVFEADGRVLTVRLAGGTFPNWKLIVPKGLPHRIEVDGSELGAALKRAAVTRGETFKTGKGASRDGVRVMLAADSLTVIVDENERGAFDESVTATSNLNGEQTETRLNPDYVTDFLATHEGRFVCEWKDGNSQMLFTWPDVAFQCVIAPMRI